MCWRSAPAPPADELAVTWELVDELRALSGRRGQIGPMRPGPAPGPSSRGPGTAPGPVGSRPRAYATPGTVPPGGSRPMARPIRGMPMRRLPPEQERARAQRVELLSLFALGRDFQLRLSAQVASGLVRQAPRAGTPNRARQRRPALVAALTGRLAPAAGPWLGLDPDAVRATMHEGPGWGSVERDGPGLRAALPLSWLARVWAPGFPVVGRPPGRGRAGGQLAAGAGARAAGAGSGACRPEHPGRR